MNVVPALTVQARSLPTPPREASQGLTCLVPREATKARTSGGMRRLGGAT